MLCDMAKESRSYTPEQWARLSPAFRAAHNRLRAVRGLPPIPEPKVDRYKPPRGGVRLFDPADPEAVAAAADFGREVDNNPPDEVFLDWARKNAGGPEGKIAKQLALELARIQLANRRLHTEELYRAIAQFVALAQKESGWPRKAIISNAMQIYGVGVRTIETAIAKYSEQANFTDGTKLGPAVTPFRGLPVELRWALGLPLPR
jgi:hypothetical protein